MSFEFEVSEERLLQLLDHGAESDRLDYKETIDLDKKSGVVELAKDLGAFSALGGHIVVGAKDDGSPGALMDDKIWELFDAARVTSKVAKYLPDIRPEVARRLIDGVRYAVLYIPPVDAGLVVFCEDGAYKHPSGKLKLVFRRGDIFVRRGTASVRWQQGDYEAALERVMQKRKERWLEENRSVLEQYVHGTTSQRLAAGPRTTLNWTLDVATFGEVLVEQVRTGDLVPLTLMLQELPATAFKSLRGTNPVSDFVTILDRVALTGVVGIRVHSDVLIRESILMLRRLLLETRDVSEPKWDGPVLELEVLFRVYAIGAAAVRFQRFDIVRETALVEIPSALGRGQDLPWIRKIGRDAALANLLEGTNDRPYLLVRVHESLRELGYTHADLSSSRSERLLDSLLQFDLLACVAVLAKGDDPNYSLHCPSFGYFFPDRLEGVLLSVVQRDDVRRELGVQEIDVPRIVQRLTLGARAAARTVPGWRGWSSEVLLALLQ